MGLLLDDFLYCHNLWIGLPFTPHPPSEKPDTQARIGEQSEASTVGSLGKAVILQGELSYCLSLGFSKQREKTTTNTTQNQANVLVMHCRKWQQLGIFIGKVFHTTSSPLTQGNDKVV